MLDINILIYQHKHSAPSPGSPLYSKRHAPFSASAPAESPMHVLHYLLGLQILWPIMLAVRSMDLLVNMSMSIFEHPQMVDAQIMLTL